MALDLGLSSPEARTPNPLVPVSDADIDELLEDAAALNQDPLGFHVRSCFGRADDERRASGVEDRLFKIQRALRMEYDPEDIALIEKGQDVYLGVIQLKCRAAESWINDILTNEGEKPWTTDSTPIPDLPETLKEAIVRMVRTELMELFAQGLSPDVEDIAMRVDNLKDRAMRMAEDEADERNGRMETVLADQMIEGGFYPAFKEMITDLVAFPIGCLLTPSVQMKKELKWNGDTVAVENKPAMCTERYSPFDVYPSPDSKTTQDGEYIILRSKIPFSSVTEMLEMPGFIEENVEQVLQRWGEVGIGMDTQHTDSARKHLEDRPEVYDHLSNQFETLKYFGKVRASLLSENGVEIDSEDDKVYEAEVWTIGDLVVRAILNPHPLDTRPVFKTSFRKVPGSFWGQGLGDILRDIGRICNASARSLVRNMAYSSGPMGEVDTSRLADNEVPNQIMPMRLYHVDPDLTGGGRQAFTFYKVDSNASELIAVYNHYSQLADDHSGVPAYVLGNPQVAGAGRTMGGLSMLMGNAAKGIKQVMSNVDADVLSPVVQSLWGFNMKYNQDSTIKGDINVIAMGARGLLQRELSQARAVELLQLLTPYAQAGVVPPAAVVKLIKEIVASMGYDPEMIPDEQVVDVAQQAALAAQQQQPAPQGDVIAPAQPQPLSAPQ